VLSHSRLNPMNKADEASQPQRSVRGNFTLTATPRSHNTRATRRQSGAIAGQFGHYAKGGTVTSQTRAEVYPQGGGPGQRATENYGLHAGVLGPLETLAQSVSAMAPSTSPSLTIPLVFALAGNATWFVYLLATGATLLVGFCVSRFARLSASPGSLYTYASMILPPSLGATAAWSLLLAYIATGASVIGGFYHYANLLLRDATGHGLSAAFLAVLVTAISICIAWRDVKISARLMLWIEAVSVSVILIVVALVFFRNGWHLDWPQLQLRGMSGSGLRLGLVLALFSFVGFESATTLGGEARKPLRNIPRAVIASLLITLWIGRKPTLRTLEMLQFYFSGWATEDELNVHLEKLKTLDQ